MSFICQIPKFLYFPLQTLLSASLQLLALVLIKPITQHEDQLTSFQRKSVSSSYSNLLSSFTCCALVYIRKILVEDSVSQGRIIEIWNFSLLGWFPNSVEVLKFYRSIWCLTAAWILHSRKQVVLSSKAEDYKATSPCPDPSVPAKND